MKTELEKAWDEFKEVYLEQSSIEEITFNNPKQKWIVKYNYDVENDEFESLSDMIEFFNADQFGN